MTKLTNPIRVAIQNAAINDTFDKEEIALRDREMDLMEQIYHSLVPETERKALAKIATCWLKVSNAFYVNAGGYQVFLRAKQNCPDRWTYSRIDLKDEKMIAAARAIADDWESHKERKRNATKALGQLLQTATTFEKLKQAWPEGKEYWEPLWVRAVTPTNLPSVEVKAINAMLGLPKDIAQAAQAA